MVILCIARFNIQTFCFLPINRIYVFCRLSDKTKTAIISLYGIKEEVFITETESVYCAVRTESLNVIQFNLRFEKVITF